MGNRIRRLLNQFLRKSRVINNQPLNKVSLIIIILVDIFILINVFTGLDDISRWPLSPSQAYPCYQDWQDYRTKTNSDKDYQIARLLLNNIDGNHQAQYEENQRNHLGQVSSICWQYAEYKDKINKAENRQIIKDIEQKETQISTLKQANAQIRSQYDSTLLEKIAGQPRGQSINLVGAEKAKQELELNERSITQLEQEIANLKNQFITQPESRNFITFIQKDNEFKAVEQGYKHASFWHPSIQLIFQALFLLPLIVLASSIHQFAQRRNYGLISLISWHLLVIFFIPLLLKIFEFLQIGAIFQGIFDIILAVFGQLLFLLSYFYILLIPLIGFGLIKLFQQIILNPKLQTVARVQKSLCVKCAKKLRQDDAYCPYCGYYQYLECQSCHNPTYKHLPYCKHCGSLQSNE